jgi:Transposase
MSKPQANDALPNESKCKRRRRRNKGMCLEDRPVLQPDAAGIDVGAREMFVAVPPGRDNIPVRVFATFTEDLQRLVDWLVHCRVTTVALESTGVYWIPLYELLEQRGIRPCLVNARHMKNYRDEALTGTSANGCNSCTRWDYFGCVSTGAGHLRRSDAAAAP